MQRIGDWIETYTSKKFWALDPNPEDINEMDIAHALSMICRFSGHCKFFYSVAQHSINCSKYLKENGYSKTYQLYALLHDASEAYICDIPKPIKPLIQGYRDIEENIQNVIYNKYGLEVPNCDDHKIIKLADNRMLILESTILMNNVDNWFTKDTDSKFLIQEEDMKKIQNEFLTMLSELL